jgi:hypothetical protein
MAHSFIGNHIAQSSLAFFLPSSVLAHLSIIDIIIIASYFVMVVWIGIYLKGQSNTSVDFFMAGRQMSAWIAGLSFLSANLGSLELMGWAGSAYQYGILAAHWYWIGAIPAMLFMGLVMMPFYYICKTNSVPGYLKLRFGESSRVLSGVCFAFMTILMSGVNMFAMALVMKVVLGWNISFSILMSSVVVALYVGLGGLRSAIFNEVLQFALIWCGALLVPILGLIEAGGWHNLQAKIHLRVPSSGQSVSLRFCDLHGPVVALPCAQGAAQHFLNFLPLPQGQGSLRPILGAAGGAEGFPARARRRRSMSERSSGWSGSMPTITFQWCFSQRATISSPLGIVCTRTTAGRLSDPSLAILDSPCEYRIPAYRVVPGSAICMVRRECSILRSIHSSTKRLKRLWVAIWRRISFTDS